MTLTEIEQYILSKENSKKHAIPQWKYIRYTIFDCMFAAFEDINEETVLTVWGRFPQYEQKYSDLIVPAINNEPLHFTSIYIMRGIIPIHVIKSMIDFSYKERLSTVPKVTSAVKRFENIPYCGISPFYIPAIPKKDAEICATETSNGEEHECTENTGRFNNVPYKIMHDKKEFERYIRLRQQLNKSNKRKH